MNGNHNKNLLDTNGNQIKLYDVCKSDTTCEMVLIINAKNENENVRLFVSKCNHKVS